MKKSYFEFLKYFNNGKDKFLLSESGKISFNAFPLYKVLFKKHDNPKFLTFLNAIQPSRL